MAIAGDSVRKDVKALYYYEKLIRCNNCELCNKNNFDTMGVVGQYVSSDFGQLNIKCSKGAYVLYHKRKGCLVDLHFFGNENSLF